MSSSPNRRRGGADRVRSARASLARLAPLVLCLAIAAPASAQRGGGRGGGAGAAAAPVPDALAPRWPDGHVALGSSKAAKGYWEVRPGLGGGARAADVPMQPWARALQQYRGSRIDLYPPSINCKPTSGPGFFLAPGFDFIDAPDQQSIFIVNIAGAHSWRQIFMDGRPHPTGEALRPTFLGHSTGKWEGDTLVIDTVGFNEKTWIAGSYPTTTQLHMTERITRTGLKSLNYEATFDDPGAYTGPWSVRWAITPRTASSWIEGGEIFEYICQDDRNDVTRESAN
jgi:hypothetical protein